MAPGDRDKGKSGRLAAVTLDESSIGRASRDVEHERAVAIYDLIEDNSFRPSGHDGGPYALNLAIDGSRLVFDIRQSDDTPVVATAITRRSAGRRPTASKRSTWRAARCTTRARAS